MLDTKRDSVIASDTLLIVDPSAIDARLNSSTALWMFLPDWINSMVVLVVSTTAPPKVVMSPSAVGLRVAVAPWAMLDSAIRQMPAATPVRFPYIFIIYS